MILISAKRSAFSAIARFSRVAAVAGLCLNAVAQASLQALAQDASARPSHASEAVGALERARWEVLDDGLALIDVSTALGTRITAFRIDPTVYRFSVVEQDKRKGERASNVLERLGADIVVNGGFFSIAGDDELKPVGMLILNGQARSIAWKQDGGFLVVSPDGKPAITLSPDGPPKGAVNAIQSKPVLIEPGGNWAMNTNSINLERRTLFCILPDGQTVLALIHGGGLSLFEAGWTLRGREWGGYFGCDSAIALDGGSSSQMAVRDREDLSVTGLARVQNFLAVSKR